MFLEKNAAEGQPAWSPIPWQPERDYADHRGSLLQPLTRLDVHDKSLER
jgi:hypothetical protein